MDTVTQDKPFIAFIPLTMELAIKMTKQHLMIFPLKIAGIENIAFCLVRKYKNVPLQKSQAICWVIGRKWT